MDNIAGEALKKHSYLMGLQIAALIEAMAMHWENQKALQEGRTIPYTKSFKKLIETSDDVLSHKGITSHWQGVTL